MCRQNPIIAMTLIALAGAGGGIRSENRLAARVSVPLMTGTTAAAVSAAAEKSSFEVFDPDENPDSRPPASALVIQASLARRNGIAGAANARRADFLYALAGSVNSEWMPVGTSWVLTDVPGLEHLVMLSNRDRMDRMGTLGNPVGELSPEQVQRLKSGGTLGVRDLTPRQIALAKYDAVCRYIGGGYGREALDLDGLLFQLPKVYGGGNPGTPEVAKLVRGLDGAWIPVSHTPIDRIRVVPVANQSPVARVALQSREPANNAPDADLSPLEAKQLGTFRGSETVKDAVLRAAAGSSLVFMSRLDRRPAHLQGEETAADVLRQAAALTGGTWKEVGGVDFLSTPPDLDRAAALQPAARAERLRELFEAWCSRLPRELRESLRNGSTLEPSALPQANAAELKKIATVAFAHYVDLKPEALVLTGLKLGLDDQKRLVLSSQSTWSGTGLALCTSENKLK